MNESTEQISLLQKAGTTDSFSSPSEISPPGRGNRTEEIEAFGSSQRDEIEANGSCMDKESHSAGVGLPNSGLEIEQESEMLELPPRDPEATANQEKEALQILRSIADGYHPFTGRALPNDSCYQSAKVLRAMLAGIRALETEVKRKSKVIPPGAGRPWTKEEEENLVSDFEKQISLSDLVQKYQRTRRGIYSRLIKLNKVVPVSKK